MTIESQGVYKIALALHRYDYLIIRIDCLNNIEDIVFI